MRNMTRSATGAALGILATTTITAVTLACTQQARTVPIEGSSTELKAGESITFRSEVLGEMRTVLVRTPEGYENTSASFPVLYVLDGEYSFQQATAAVQFQSELGYQSGQHAIPEMIVVGIVNVDRDRDYTPTHAPEQAGGRMSFPTSGGAQAFAESFEDELFPLIDARYRTEPYRVVSGWSLGGLFTVHTYLETPDLFSAYLAISPSMWWDDSVMIKRAKRLLGEGAVTDKPLVVTLGSLEGGDMGNSVRENLLPLIGALRSDDVRFKYVEVAGEGHYTVPFKAYFDGLSALFDDWHVPNDALAAGLQAVGDFYADLSARYGYHVRTPLAVYCLLSNTLPDVEPAISAAREAVQNYPHSA